MSPAGVEYLTVDMNDPDASGYAAQCSDGHPFVETYRGNSQSAAHQAVAKHNAVVHGISRFGRTPSSAASEET